MVSPQRAGDHAPLAGDLHTLSLRPDIGYQLQQDQDLVEIGVPDWIVVTRAIGHDPWNRSGANFDAHTALGVQVVCRLEHGPYPTGTLPFSQNYGAFARRCANFVAASSGCHVWVIGNEPNFGERWPALLPDPDSTADRAASDRPNAGGPDTGLPGADR
ncbi:MAG: hypothetical protein WDZ49_02270, partial [Litorilinea sp.]